MWAQEKLEGADEHKQEGQKNSSKEKKRWSAKAEKCAAKALEMVGEARADEEPLAHKKWERAHWKLCDVVNKKKVGNDSDEDEEVLIDHDAMCEEA